MNVPSLVLAISVFSATQWPLPYDLDKVTKGTKVTILAGLWTPSDLPDPSGSLLTVHYPLGDLSFRAFSIVLYVEALRIAIHMVVFILGENVWCLTFGVMQAVSFPSK